MSKVNTFQKSQLTKSEIELENLVIDYQTNHNDDVFQEIFTKYKPKFERCSRRMNNEDIVQELSIALLSACRTFKKDHKAKFNTYFWSIARNHLGLLRTQKLAYKRMAQNNQISLQALASEEANHDAEFIDMLEDPHGEQQIHDKLLNIFLETEFYTHLPEVTSNIFHYLIQGYAPMDIAKILNISVVTVHNKVKKIRSMKLFSKVLIKYFGDKIIPLIEEKQNSPNNIFCTEQNIAKMLLAKMRFRPGTEVIIGVNS